MIWHEELAEVPKERQTEGVDFGAFGGMVFWAFGTPRSVWKPLTMASFNQGGGFSQQRCGFKDKHLDGSKQYKERAKH